ncbi:unnamed protein product [Peniophora sp. CBMAI 1063]|nr:unnamed protein product [Peniophora sp. CBMAI 1063]
MTAPNTNILSQKARLISRRQFVHIWALWDDCDMRSAGPLVLAVVVMLPKSSQAADTNISSTNSSSCSLPPKFTTTNFTACMQAFHSLPATCHDLPGLYDNKRNPVSSPQDATAISLELCRSVCGASPEPFQWNTFSPQFGAWLLPWLALIPQLPFGSRNRSDNLMSMLLVLGSPALGAYSLIFTALNGHWISRRLSGIRYPNVKNAWRVLSSLQQSALRIDDEQGHFSSLIVASENDGWWKELARELDYKQTWSLAIVAQIAWVLVAFIFLWLLPIVIGYLQLAPKCDDEKVRGAVEYVNKSKAYLAGSGADSKPERVTPGHYGLRIEGRESGEVNKDEQACAPIFNYARFLPWTMCAEYVARAYDLADRKVINHKSVSGVWKEHCMLCKESDVCCRNREGNIEQVRLYTKDDEGLRGLIATGVFGRFLISSAIAFALLWGTVGGGIVVVLYTPTKGLGCRSGAYILYAAVATVIWLFMVLVSVLSYYASPPAVLTSETKYHAIAEDDDETLDNHGAIPLDTLAHSGGGPTEVNVTLLPHAQASPRRQTPSARLAANFAVGFRRLGKTLAIANSAWIILVCIMQFSNIFDECFCNASTIGLGSSAYFVINLQPGDVQAMRLTWGYALGLSLGTAAAFVVFVALFVDPPTPEVVRGR